MANAPGTLEHSLCLGKGECENALTLIFCLCQVSVAVLLDNFVTASVHMLLEKEDTAYLERKKAGPVRTQGNLKLEKREGLSEGGKERGVGQSVGVGLWGQ